MSEYNHQLIGMIGVDDESNNGKPLGISVGVDTLDMCTISFGNQYSIRIPEEDVDKLRRILHDASRKLMVQRVDREYNVVYGVHEDEAAEEMDTEADDYNPEAEVAELYRS
jgi:hypothetical protein